MIRLLVAASSSIVRAGLESIAGSNAAITLVGGASDLKSLASAVEELQPDVVLVAFEIGQGQAPEELLTLAASGQGPAIVLLAQDSQPDWTAEALHSGVRAVLPREASREEILAAIEAAAAGLVVLHPHDLHTVLSIPQQGDRPEATFQAQPLSPREIEVLGMLAEGLGNKTIAWKLGISEHTVKFHVASIMSKLNAASRTEAVTIGIRRGLIMV